MFMRRPAAVPVHAERAMIRFLIPLLASLTVPNPAFSQDMSPAVPARVRYEQDIVYAQPNGGKELKLDVARPAVGKGPFPTVVLIPGGGWLYKGRKFKVPFQLELASRGYVAVSLDYRGTPQSQFPAQVYDAKAAVRWLRTNAARFNIDTERVAAIGYSAGGNVATLLGLTRPNDGLEGIKEKPATSSAVSLVVSCQGISDFVTLYNKHCLAEPATIQRRYVRLVL